jgi:hypothetical protein
VSVEYIAGLVAGLLLGALVGVIVGVPLGNWCRETVERVCPGKPSRNADIPCLLQSEQDWSRELCEAVARLDLVTGMVMEGEIRLDRLGAQGAGGEKAPEEDAHDE